MASVIQNSHPFYPLEADIVGYLANELSVSALLASFALGCALILGGILVLLRLNKPLLGATEQAIVLWFMLSGTIHLFFEGYFALNHTSMAGKQDLFGQLWKEYSFSDSRYMTSDPFVLCMETITAVCWGPLSFLVAFLIAAESPLRHPLQALVSLGQIYGDVLYFATSMFDHYHKGLSYCRPEAYYFWIYYFSMNIIWIVVPGILLYSSIAKSTAAFSDLSRLSSEQRSNDHSNDHLSQKKVI